MLTDIVVLIDKSGSMAKLADDVVGGFNRFLADQQALPDPAVLTLAFFDTDYRVVHRRVPLQQVPALTADGYQPGGLTALLDAIGLTIRKLDESQPPSDKTLFVIISDGYENSSREYTLPAVRALIEAREKTGKWQTVYLGANQDSFAEAGAIGGKSANAANWDSRARHGARTAFVSASANLQHYRQGGTPDDLDPAWRPDTEQKSGGERNRDGS